MYVKDVEARGAVGIAISASALVVLVAAAAKSLVSCAGEYYYANVGAVAADAECFEYLVVGLRPEGVIYFGTVDGDTGYAVVCVKKDVAVFFYGCPLACHVEFVYECVIGCYMLLDANVCYCRHVAVECR